MSGGGLTGTGGLLSQLDPVGKTITNNSYIGDPFGIYHNSNANINAQNAANANGIGYLPTLAGGTTGGLGSPGWNTNPMLAGGLFNQMSQGGALPFYQGAKGATNVPGAGRGLYNPNPTAAAPYGISPSQALSLAAMFF